MKWENDKMFNGLMKNNMKPVHPGVILKEEFMGPSNISVKKLSTIIKMQEERLNEIVIGDRIITVNVAIRLGIAFKTTAHFWLNLQNNYDVSTFELKHGDKIKREVTVI